MTKSSITIFQTVKSMRDYSLKCIKQDLKIGLIPTMGFLHEGHLSLVKKSLNENDITLVSIFVNPSQFAPHEDLDSYPRNFENDLSLLESINLNNKRVNGIFAPNVNEMYPSDIILDPLSQKGAFIEVKGVSEQLEGSSRPQFFKGVATIVTKLFNVIMPNNAYFGQKDAQQAIVIKQMVKDLLMDVNIKVMPIVREPSGLALSSRNSYLSSENRLKASIINKLLKSVEFAYLQDNVYKVDELLNIVKSGLKEYITPEHNYQLDYISLNDLDNLNYLYDEIDPAKGALLSIAVKVPNIGNDNSKTTRLIDNINLLPKL